MAKYLTTKIVAGDDGNIAVLTLDNEKALNALNIEMIDALQKTLDDCEHDHTIKALFIQGAGEKAFCAGGDVVSLYHSMQETAKGDIPKKACEFFTKEYQLDYRLHTYPKPIISWGHGIVMGGGIGVMSACSHRIVTEKSMLAMPEVTIGLYPDVGASWFFNRMPKNVGLFLGLTGSRINASDAIFTKLADCFVLHEYKDELLADLAQCKWMDPHCDVQNTINNLSGFSEDEAPISNIRENYDEINDLLAHCELQEKINNLKNTEPKSKWLAFAQKGFLKGCPITYKLVDEQIKRAKHLSLKQVFQMELIVSTRCAMNPDLQEGIRALLIEKDGKPIWSVDSINAIDAQQTNQFFTPPWSGQHPLERL